MGKAPLFLKKYFWDVDFSKLNVSKNPTYIIERLLEMGDAEALRWLFKNFDKETIKKTLRERRGFSKLAANFWGIILDIPREEILCFKKGFPNPPIRIWPY
jgi:hypothetical protein